MMLEQNKNDLSKNGAKLIFSALVFTTLLSSTVEAKKFLIKFQSPSQFNHLAQALKMEKMMNRSAPRNILGLTETKGLKLFGTQAVMTQSLDHLGMAFVDVKSQEDLDLLKDAKGIASIEEDVITPLPFKPLVRSSSLEERLSLNSNSEMTWGVAAVDAPGAWSQGARGDNIKVAVLDTGIDKDHPDLKNRFLAGQDFVSSSGGFDDGFSRRAPVLGQVFGLQTFALQNEDDASGEAVPPYPYFDQHGHGTHVSGTIAAEANGKGVVGVAPNARILMGRVCGRFGCSNFSVLKGINWAIDSKAHVISMSLGGSQNVPSQQEALNRAYQMGIVSVAATGNDGTNEISFPGAYESVIGVGAVDSTLKRASFSQYGPELDVVAPGVGVNSTVPLGSGRASQVYIQLNGQRVDANSTSFSGSPEVSTPLSSELVVSGLGKPEDFTSAVAGRFALIQRGELPFADKVKNAIAAGAKGVVIYNNAPGLISGAVTQDGSIVAIPVVMIEKDIGEAIVGSISAGNNASATLMTLKTDYAEFQGTSMATPHVSGVVALILSKNPSLTPEQVRKVLYSTATPGPTSSENEYGHGVVNAAAACRGL